jgi:hypothetical protein
MLEEFKSKSKRLRKLVKTRNQAINSDLERQEIEVLYGKYIRSKLKDGTSKQDGSSNNLKESFDGFVNGIKNITVREKLLIDKFRELIMQ